MRDGVGCGVLCQLDGTANWSSGILLNCTTRWRRAASRGCSARKRRYGGLQQPVVGPRHRSALLTVIIEAAQARLALYPEGVQCEGDDVVLADEHRHLDELALVEVCGEYRPGVIGDAGVGVELVDGAEHCALQFGPSSRLGAALDPGDLLVRESHPAREDGVLSHSYSERQSQPVRRMASSRRRGGRAPLTARETVKVIHWRRRLGCRTSVSKVLPVALEPMLSISRRDSASRSPGGSGWIRGNDGLTMCFIRASTEMKILQQL
jgi:hypothetical protein